MTFDNHTVYVLDSYGLIFRCYFAFINRPLTNPKGENISALFGFFRNFHYILEHYKPGHIIAAMDSKTKTFRHDFYPEYKATRNKTPEDLHAQIPWICEILQALGIPILQCDGYEADDVIATVAKKCAETGRTCRILSGDKDLMQLVNDSTQILKPENGGGWKVTGEEGVIAEWGVKPAQLLDLLSLYGDTADNIPGVQGVGVKTAGKLLNDYQNLDRIYAHIDEIKGAMQKKLVDGKENAYFSQKLVRLCDTVPCEEIDRAISQPLNLNFAAAATALESYGALQPAKQYAELAVKAGQTVTLEAAGNTTAGLLAAKQTKSGSVKGTDNVGGLTTEPTIASATQEIIPIRKNDTSNYKAITKLADLDAYITAFISSGTKRIAYDCETTSLDTLNTTLVGFSLCYQAGHAVYVPIQLPSEDLFNQTDYIELKDALTQLLRIFKNPDITVIMHNAKFDLKVFFSSINKAFSQTELTGILNKEKTLGLECRLFDTMITAWLENSDRMGKNAYGLEYLCETKLGLAGIEYDDIVEKGKTFADVPLETAYAYAAEDADFTLQLADHLTASWLTPGGETAQKLFDLEHTLLPVLAQMEITGIHLDSAFLNTYNEELTEKLAQVQAQIHQTVGHEFNIASPKQLQTVLFDELGLPRGKKTATGYSTDTSVLEELAAVNPVPKMILEYRELAKLQSTYVETLPKLTDSAGRIHTSFIQTGTATGRLSCRDPNLQNIPVRNDAGRKIRQAFTAPKGKVLISADYAQIELVVLAHLSGDQNMCKAFIEGTDVHRATASMIFGVSPDSVTPEMRRTAKTINFGVIYGMSAFSLAKDLGISRTQAQNFIDMYFRTYSSVSSFMTKVISDAEATGCVSTMFGRRRPIMNINSRNKLEKSGAERIAKNTPIQGTAADIVKHAMLSVTQALTESNSPARLLLQVHDELIFECPEDQATVDQTIALIRDKMENTVKLSVPLRVSIEYGKNWGEFH
ncbi:DNA polymerase I [Treponema sp. C6A8]|uniref:DNA polymerase I n=1 Tax=Treponema sp. C6A8 TaxID=1410609 RepID=UPI00056EB0CB|nr:DNA polymerase I [Treponema sp. C6A8]